MNDIAPELLSKVQKEFSTEISKSNVIKSLFEKISKGNATYAEANEYAIEVGRILAKAYKNNISSSVLPDGKMYYNIAKRVIEPTMKVNYELVANVAEHVQNSLNKKANISIKAIKPKLNQDKINGIVNRISSEDNFDDVAWILDEPIKTFTQSVIDDSIKANASFQYQSGMTPKIIRTVSGNCCKWCQQVAGKYDYPDVPKDVYRRHNRCRCIVEYFPGDGKVQNVHSKMVRDETEIEKRKRIGLYDEQKEKEKRIILSKTLEQKNTKLNKSFEKIDNIKLTNEELKAINDYVSSYSYIINEKLRNGDVLELSDIQFIENMDKALKKYPVFEGTLKRSVTFYDQNALNEFLELHSIDNVVQYKQYLSTTKGKVYNPDAQVQIYIQNAKKGRDISINNAKENEVLYPRDTSFNILNRVENNGKHYILMEEIDE